MSVPPTNVVVLTRDRASADELTRVASHDARLAGVEAATMEGEASTRSAVATARARHPHAPLAVIVGSEPDAIEAVSAGADEALVLPTPDAMHVALLVERARLRASQRLADASARESAAHADKLAALGTVVAGVAHEINNPLAAVLLSIEALSLSVTPLFDVAQEVARLAALGRGIDAEELAKLAARGRSGSRLTEAREILEETASHVQTIADVVRDLRIFARVDDNETPQAVNVIDLIEGVLRIVGREVAQRAHIERDYAESLPTLAVPRSRLVQVITNVLVNAAHAVQDIERVVHRIRITARADADYVAISISDTGPGIPADALERIFDPFYTTKRVGTGTGLGLSISRSILRRLGGDLLVESVHGTGATFIALVPVPSSEALRQAMRAGSTPGRALRPQRSRPSVLVVEDDDRLLRAYPRILRDRYDVLLASDGQEAIDLLSSGSTADVMLVDLAMPEIDGQHLYAWLVENRPELARRTIFITGGLQGEPYAELVAVAPNGVLEKPIARERLLEAIDAVLSKRA